MERFVILTALVCCAVLALPLAGGAVVSPEHLDLLEHNGLENIYPVDLNLTEVSEGMRASHPHAKLNVAEVIQLHEYGAETHTVITSDGYILELQRITGNKENPNPHGKPVVLLMHGLLCSAMDWVLTGPERGLGFLLADAGYDVWMGNARGSRYSRKHVNLTVNDKNYWNFDWHEIGTHDIPTKIDYILKQTGQDKLGYIAHSQGSTAFFVMMSEHPEFSDKIKIMFSFGPVAYCSNMYSPFFQLLSRLTPALNLIADLIGVNEIQPTGKFFKTFTSVFCAEHAISQPVCSNIVFLIAGFNQDQFDPALLPALVSHVPAGSSINQFVHYAQMIKSGHFRKFDHGFFGNIRNYGSYAPPSYRLANVKVPVSLHYGPNDWLSHPADVEKLRSKLPKSIGKFRVPHDNFNHLDYLYAKDVKFLLYDKVMSILRRYKD